MSERSPEWMLGYKAAKDGAVVAEGKSNDWLSGWLVGHRDRQDDEIMDTIDQHWAD